MKSITTQLAETLFIEMINGKPNLSMNDVDEMAISSLQYASMFYSKVQDSVEKTVPVTYRLKGCKACFGSGGKHNSPCKACGGSGKVQSRD
jgi:hypothetical protein